MLHGNTLQALQRLVSTRALSAEDHAALQSAYLFLRRVENRLQMVSPEYEIIEEEEESLSLKRIVPIYPLTRGMTQRYLRRTINRCIDEYQDQLQDVLPVPIRNRFADWHDEITAWRHDFHAHPELMFEVHRTAGLVAERLRAFGCDEVVEGIGRTGVVGVIKGSTDYGGRVVGMRGQA